MKLNKIQSFIRSRKKSILISAAVAPFLSVGVGVLMTVVTAHADTSNRVTGCLTNQYEGLYNFQLGASPLNPCASGDSQVTFDYGDITSVIAGTGLTGGATQGDATVSLADGGVSTAKLADGSVTTAKLADNSVTQSKLSSDLSAGWYAANETWTYASSDAPAFTFTVSGDDTGRYSPGMRVKLTQTTDKYFIITAVSYSSGTTTVTVYGGTDYTLANASITSPYFSMVKAPVGFPLDPAKWELETVVSTIQQTLSPSTNTWYNTGSNSIILPIGLWNISMKGVAEGYKIGGTATMVACTLSTANNTESDSEMTQYGETATGGDTYLSFSIQKPIGVTTKTTYYLNLSTGGSSYYGIYIRGDYTPLVIRAVSAYL